MIKTHYQNITSSGVEFVKLGALNVVRNSDIDAFISYSGNVSGNVSPFFNTIKSHAVISRDTTNLAKFSISRIIYNTNKLQTVRISSFNHLSSPLDNFQINFSTSLESSITDFDINLFTKNNDTLTPVSDYYLSPITKIGKTRFYASGNITSALPGQFIADVNFKQVNQKSTELIYYDPSNPSNVDIHTSFIDLSAYLNITFDKDTTIDCNVSLYVDDVLFNKQTGKNKNDNITLTLTGLSELTTYKLEAQIEDPFGRINSIVKYISTNEITLPDVSINYINVLRNTTIEFEITASDSSSQIGNITYFVSQDSLSRTNAIELLTTLHPIQTSINQSSYTNVYTQTKYITHSGLFNDINEYSEYNIWLFIEDVYGNSTVIRSDNINIIHQSPVLYSNVTEGLDGLSIHLDSNVSHYFSTDIYYITYTNPISDSYINYVKQYGTKVSNTNNLSLTIPIDYTKPIYYIIYTENRNNLYDISTGNITLNRILSFNEISTESLYSIGDYISLDFNTVNDSGNISIDMYTESHNKILTHFDTISKKLFFTEFVSPINNEPVYVTLQYKSQPMFTQYTNNIYYDLLAPFNISSELNQQSKQLVISFDDDTDLESNIMLNDVLQQSVNHQSSFDVSHLNSDLEHTLTIKIQDRCNRIVETQRNLIFDDYDPPVISDVYISDKRLNGNISLLIQCTINERSSFTVDISVYSHNIDNNKIQQSFSNLTQINTEISTAYSTLSLSNQPLYPTNYTIVITVSETDNIIENLESNITYPYTIINYPSDFTHYNINPTHTHFEVSTTIYNSTFTHYAFDSFDKPYDTPVLLNYFRTIPHSSLNSNYCHIRSYLYDFANIDLLNPISSDIHISGVSYFANNDVSNIIFAPDQSTHSDFNISHSKYYRSNISDSIPLITYLYIKDENGNESILSDFVFNKLDSRSPFIINETSTISFINETSEVVVNFPELSAESIEGFYPLSLTKTHPSDTEISFNSNTDIRYLDENAPDVLHGIHIPTTINGTKYLPFKHHPFIIPETINNFVYFKSFV